ncbi:MAG: hypothetical protein JNK58_07315 [Phycisphaerae bacterium]|nr:hypothetical protein [Phycisphaerae bacterium]
MPRRTHTGLIALNALLMGLLALVTLAPGANAQTRPKRATGQYAIVDGRIQGVAEAAIYVYDTANQEMLALRWDRSRKMLQTLGHRDLAADAEHAQKGGR